jgi:DNA polymerase I-like protein with 3'-5' exonuclease and polymerase domains
VLEGERPDREEEGIDHRVCYSLEEAEEWAEEAEAVLAPLPRRDRLVALDLEWEGRRAVNNKETKDKDGNSVPPPSWVATIQVSWGHKQAICFVLRSVHGKVVFTDQEERPAIRRLIQLLNRFFRGKRLVGHFLNADLEFAQILGLKPLADCPVPLADGPDGRPPWELMRDDGAGWLDVGLMSHAVEETSPLGLEAISLRYTTAPRYDAALNEWREAKKKASEIITGYGRCDRDILTKYGNYDADVTRRAAVALLPLLSDDYEHHDVWESFWESMITQPVILEMMTCGIRVDRHRVDQLTASFMRARARVEEELREWARWPEFNMRSTLEVREFLYGEELSRKVDKNGNVQRIRPPDALCLHLTPLLDTSKPPRRWDDLVRRGQAGESAPSTNKMVLGIMAQDAVAAGDDELAKPLMLLRDQRFLDQALKQMLRVPKVATEIEKKKEGRRGAADVDNAEAAHAAEVAQVEEEVYRYHRAMPSVVPDDPSSHKAPFVEDIRDTLLPVGGGLYERDGDLWVYDDGIVGCLDQDGKVRTHLSPTADTGRWKSWRPNLQNGAKSRDADYERLLGDAYEHKMRSIFVPDDGKVFIDFDLKGAELAAMAILSGSKVMLDHCERGLLPQSDPRYYDIHCNIAKMVFKLDLPPLPSAFKEAGVGHLRNLAKTVIFGLAYGRGAKAIAFGAREQGVTISVEEVEAIIAQVFATYPELVTFFEAAASRATRERWLRHPLGRKRRFPVARMPNIGRDFERQAKNFPVQGMVASVVDRGLAMMQYVRDHELRRRDLFDMLLQIHDAGLIQAPYANVEYLVDEFIPYCMVQSVPVYPADLEGKLLPGGPYFLGLEISVESPWGEPVTQEFCDLHGIRGNFPRGKPKKAKEKENGARRRVIR